MMNITEEYYRGITNKKVLNRHFADSQELLVKNNIKMIGFWKYLIS